MTSRMDIIGTNGNDGEHYGEEGRVELHAHKGQEPGRIAGPTGQGQKHDSEKPAMDLMPPLMELEVSKVLTFGAQKYSAENWRQVPDLHARYRSAAKRHINALRRGEMYDEESGCHHAAHAVCCLMFLGEIDLEISASEA